MRLINASHKKFINSFVRSGDIEIAIKDSGVSKATAGNLMRRYKSIYEGFFERLGMSKEMVIKEHIDLIKNAVKSTKVTADGALETSYDNNVKLRAIDSYYKLIKAIEEPSINISTSIYTQTDAAAEKAIADEIAKNGELTKLMMAQIEKLKIGGKGV